MIRDKAISISIDLLTPLSLSLSLSLCIQDEVLSDQSTSSQSHSSPIVTRPHSQSTPILPPVFSPTSTTSTPSQGEDFDRGNWRSQSFSVSRPIPMRPRVLHLSEPNSTPSSPRQRSLSGSLMTISVTAFGLALMSYLQS